jgi:hypothetical protein
MRPSVLRRRPSRDSDTISSVIDYSSDSSGSPKRELSRKRDKKATWRQKILKDQERDDTRANADTEKQDTETHITDGEPGVPPNDGSSPGSSKERTMSLDSDRRSVSCVKWR